MLRLIESKNKMVPFQTEIVYLNKEPNRRTELKALASNDDDLTLPQVVIGHYSLSPHCEFNGKLLGVRSTLNHTHFPLQSLAFVCFFVAPQPFTQNSCCNVIKNN
jgi:hypothetical protein